MAVVSDTLFVVEADRWVGLDDNVYVEVKRLANVSSRIWEGYQRWAQLDKLKTIEQNRSSEGDFSCSIL